MQKEINYRILKAADLLLYREIRLHCLQNYPDNFGTLLENEGNATDLKFDAVLRQENSKSFLYGAFMGAQLIGICGFTRQEKVKTNHRGAISQLYVRNEFAGQGIGQQLLRYTLDKAFADESLEMIDLGVVNSNEQAVKLYLNIGFVQFGHFEKHFKHNDKYWGFTFMVLERETYLKGR